MQPITAFTGRVVPLGIADIDTDQIIPARFLKTIEKLGLGTNLFHDWRYLPDGTPNPRFILNQPRSRGANILLAGDNFGCGSSREHAPWALLGYGFRAVISTSFAEIFQSNCLKNGLVPVTVEDELLRELLAQAEADENLELTVNLASLSLELTDGREVDFHLDTFSWRCLVEGGDQLSYIQQHLGAIHTYENGAVQNFDTRA